MKNLITKYTQKIAHKKNAKTVALLFLKGAILDNSRGLNLKSLLPMLKKIENQAKKTHAIALIINSPGGSPVQSSLIAARIRYIADKYHLPVYAFVEDVAASGGYWLACAADEIYADQNSIIGSIGVISQGFGFTELIEKIGVERRVYTSGESKSQLDPFRAENDADIKKLKNIQNSIHQSFIDWVKSRRKEKLKKQKTIFTGEFWVSEESIKLGLIDGVAHAYPWLKEKFGDEVRLKTFAKSEPFLRKMLGRTNTLSEDVLNTGKEQYFWMKYGL